MAILTKFQYQNDINTSIEERNTELNNEANRQSNSALYGKKMEKNVFLLIYCATIEISRKNLNTTILLNSQNSKKESMELIIFNSQEPYCTKFFKILDSDSNMKVPNRKKEMFGLGSKEYQLNDISVLIVNPENYIAFPKEYLIAIIRHDSCKNVAAIKTFCGTNRCIEAHSFLPINHERSMNDNAVDDNLMKTSNIKKGPFVAPDGSVQDTIIESKQIVPKNKSRAHVKDENSVSQGRRTIKIAQPESVSQINELKLVHMDVIMDRQNNDDGVVIAIPEEDPIIWRNPVPELGEEAYKDPEMESGHIFVGD